MMRRRLHHLGSWLGLLAVICQLVLPTLHAQWWAQRAGDPALATFCGEISPLLLQELRNSPLPELLKHYRGDQAQSSRLACPFCGPLHAGHLAAPGTSLWHAIPFQPALPPPVALPSAPQVRLVRLPLLRAPPLPV